jgi:hypothetical protein
VVDLLHLIRPVAVKVAVGPFFRDLFEGSRDGAS